MDQATPRFAGHGDKDVKAAHLFLHRLLYRINRMNLFW